MNTTRPLLALAVIITFSLMLVPLHSYATHGGNHADLWIVNDYTLEGCPCPSDWRSVTTDHPTTSNSRGELYLSLSFVEGYNDFDIKLRAPNEVDTWTGIDASPQAWEDIEFELPADGSWDIWYRTWSLGQYDDGAGSLGNWFFTAFDT